MKNLRKS